MARINGVYLALASLCLAVVANAAMVAPVNPISCQDAEPITLNGSLFLGTWYEAARKPIGGDSNSEQCVQMNINYNNGTVTSQIVFSVNPNALWIKQTITNTLIESSNNGSSQQIFPGVFEVPSADSVGKTYKILETDYDTYALICGYIGISDLATSSGAFILTRERQMSFPALAQLTVNALNKYTAFDDVSLVTQTSQCY